MIDGLQVSGLAAQGSARQRKVDDLKSVKYDLL
jgi:hypothetical protein